MSFFLIQRELKLIFGWKGQWHKITKLHQGTCVPEVKQGIRHNRNENGRAG